nr:uncharacterized mitochondrial protein AtMg00810-like [Tanacetum cinerariifolium]
MSSTEAEYVDDAGCCANIFWMKSELSNYHIQYKMVSIFCDNTSEIAISNNPVLHYRTKHMISDIISSRAMSSKKALGKRLDMSMAYHPQTDRQSERTIQTLEEHVEIIDRE